MTLELIRSFLLHLIGCLKHKFLNKKAISPVRKITSPNISHYTEHEELQETTDQGTQSIFTSIVQAV